MRTISVLDKVSNPGVISIDCPTGRFAHDLPLPRSDRAIVLDLASPIYNPGSKSKVYDRSPYGNHGTIYGATWARLPSGLWCLDFDGTDDYVDCGSGASISSFASALTVEAWIRNDNPANVELINYRLTVSPFAIFQIQDGQFVVTLSDNSVTGSAFNAVLPTTWTHVVGVWSKADLKVWSYINGVVQNSIGATNDFGILNANLDKLYLGAATPTIRRADCAIVMVRIYSELALSASTIKNHYNREKHLFGV